MPGTTTIKSLIKLAKAEAERLSMKSGGISTPTLNKAIEAVLGVLASKFGHDRQIVELTEKVRAALK